MPNRSGLSKTAIAFAVVLLLSLGLCGFANSPAAGREPYGVLALSGLGLFVSIVGLIVTGIIALVRNNNKAPQ